MLIYTYAIYYHYIESLSFIAFLQVSWIYLYEKSLHQIYQVYKILG